MSNPRIIEKVLFTVMGMLFILMAWLIYGQVEFNVKCEDAGGIHASGVCINPAAVIEVN